MITDTTQILKVNADGIPDFLKAQPWWINWKPVFVDGKAKKLPTLGNAVLYGNYWDNAGRTFAEALRTMPEQGGVSLLLSEKNELACIDIDDCEADDPRLHKILQLVPNAWREVSPSGHGVHVWGALPDKAAWLLPGRKTIGSHGKEYEWYGSGRGITVTGHPLPACAKEANVAAPFTENVPGEGNDAFPLTENGRADLRNAFSLKENCLPDLTPAIAYCESLRPKITGDMQRDDRADTFPSACCNCGKTAARPAAFLPPADAILRKAFGTDPELQRMYYHGHNWSDKSREDFYFCQRMWFWLGGYGAPAIGAVFRRSALYRRSKGPHYVQLTVCNAAKYWNGNYYGKGWVA